MATPASLRPTSQLPVSLLVTAAGVSFIALFYVALLIWTRPAYIGDSYWYALDIARAGGGWVHSATAWNFAHLVLRPLGIVLYSVFGGAAASLFEGDRIAAAALPLVIVSAASAFLCALLVWRMALRAGATALASATAAAGFLAASVVMNYSRSGASYLPGLACSMGALYLAGFSTRRGLKTALVAGALMGVAALFWLPYIVSIPSVLLARPILEARRERAREYVVFGLALSAAAVATLAAVYGAAAVATHVGDWHSLAAWVRGSDSQYRDRKALRMVTGFARATYEIGNDAVWLKWFLFKDPYASVTLADIARVSLLRLGLFYGALAGLAALLWRPDGGRRLLVLGVVAAAPHIAMALLFESGSPERYLGALPVIFVGFAYAMSAPALGGWGRAAAAALCLLHAPFNLAALGSPAVTRTVEADSGRIAALAPLGTASRIYVVNGFDGAFVLRQGYPFERINWKPMPEIVAIVSPGSRVALWREDFACVALSTWKRGGEVWVTKRVLASRPERAWLWVEGDDRRVRWSDLHGFFTGLGQAGEEGGADGFFRIANTPAERDRLLAAAPGGPAACPAPAGAQ